MPAALITVVLFTAACCTATYVVGLSTGRASRPIRTITASDAAKAMADDDFYSLFGDSTLIVSGSVASAKQTTDGTLLNFATASSFGASCQVKAARTAFKPGMAITFVTQADAANREAQSVVLTGCVPP